MEAWFAKSILATLSIVPVYIAIMYFKTRLGIDPLVFLVWYFGATSLSVAIYLSVNGQAGDLMPSAPSILAMIAFGLVIGALANGLLFQAVGLAPNPGLPPIIYAGSSMITFLLSAALAGALPWLFDPVSFELKRLAGIALVLGGLYLLAGGRIGNPLQTIGS
jgi:hypothetical protein